MRISVRSAPRAKAFIRHVSDTTDFLSACARVRPRKAPQAVMALRMPRGLVEGLRAAANKAIERHGLHGWLTRECRQGTSPYQSLSLTYNPELKDPRVRNVHQATLGTSINGGDEFFYGSTQRFKNLKNTYFDTYGFRIPTPAARIDVLGEFIAECRLSLVRSRLSVIFGDQAQDYGFEDGWHRDEPVYENLRINIPLSSHRNFRLQIEHKLEKPRERSRSMTEHYLAPGSAYTLDTHLPHRVYAAARCNALRVHLVLGFSPWLRYDRKRDAWEPNQFYGSVHPFDIARDGLLHPSLKAR